MVSIKGRRLGNAAIGEVNMGARRSVEKAADRGAKPKLAKRGCERRVPSVLTESP
jgi:hypothetical protein